MKLLSTKANAPWVAGASLVLSLLTFVIGNFVLLGYERELSSVFELWMFALFASAILYLAIKRGRRVTATLFSLAFIAACVSYLVFFADRNNTFATLTGSLFYIYTILIGAVVSVLFDFLLTLNKKKGL